MVLVNLKEVKIDDGDRETTIGRYDDNVIYIIQGDNEIQIESSSAEKLATLIMMLAKGTKI